MAENILREEGLPATTPRYQFQGKIDCLRCFELELGRYYRDGQPSDYRYVIFDHVDELAFQECFEDDSAERLLMHSLVTYNFISHVIVLKMITPMHEAVHRAFSEIFGTWYRGQEGRLMPQGGAGIEGFTRKKSPDSSWNTTVLTPGRNRKWPTIIVEAGWTESMGKLKEDVLFWLRDSEQQVKVALTMNITRRGSITIQQWSSIQTAHKASVKPTQTMRITRNREVTSSQHKISGSLHIKFEDCYLRSKRNNESDFTLSSEDMSEISTAVWIHLPE
ncbi:hypothetical protein N7481_003457 [Penicillium waksmanii]|uniref:uncharacterized protein n=1 Tax=Penicillium waksmanii TaxID=69791 RepID=UPI0025492BD1|nr:uncharacterized protein N7481_003457 [Penicillium waksmanii]KAJ5988247.1 hypothetical protein N7481_003457 [Penicillium waksmanii]